MPEDSPTSDAFPSIRWPQLVVGRLVRRYKRFLADVVLETGEKVTAHCPNTGRMDACCEPGRTVYLSVHDNPKRKYPYTWEIIRMPTSMVGVNTLIGNRLIYRTLEAGVLTEFGDIQTVQREIAVANHSRIDLMLTDQRGSQIYVEVKNCTLVQNGVAMFPDAVTARGLRHIVELQRLRAAGHRVVMFYFIQRMDAASFKPADHIDPAYGQQLRQAVADGLEVIAYDVSLTTRRIRLNRRLPCEL
jgi:sugar fermentation stimulation protein A